MQKVRSYLLPAAFSLLFLVLFHSSFHLSLTVLFSIGLFNYLVFEVWSPFFFFYSLTSFPLGLLPSLVMLLNIFRFLFSFNLLYSISLFWFPFLLLLRCFISFSSSQNDFRPSCLSPPFPFFGTILLIQPSCPQ